MQDLHAFATTRKERVAKRGSVPSISPAPPVLTSGVPALRVAVVDALTMARDALRTVLAAERGFLVVGAASDGDEAVKLVLEQRPHVLLLDVALPRAGGLEALRQLKESGTPVATVVLADAVTGMDAVIALTLGARGVAFMEACPSVLYECVRAVAAGAYWIGKERVDDVVQALRRVRDEALPSPAGRLTACELQIVGAVLEGATNRDISRRLHVSVETVTRMLREVFGKVGVSRRFELALYAARHLVHDGMRHPASGGARAG